MYKLSLIIPIYNVEQYIEECLFSVIDQITSEVEVIIVNDGTPDTSMIIVRSIISELNKNIVNQFVIIDQENKGLSEARNTGIKYARGQYISFLDSDDKIMPNYFETILSLIDTKDYDIIDFNIKNSKGNIIEVREGRTSDLNSVFKSSKWYSVARVVKKKIFLKYNFLPGIYYEDLALTPLLYLEANDTIHIPKTLYWYRLNEDGITLSVSRLKNNKTINSLEKILNNYIDLYRLNNNQYIAIMVINSYFTLCGTVCNRIGLKESFDYVYLYDNLLREEIILQHQILRYLNIKALIFFKCPKLYLLLLNSYNKFRK